MWPLFFNKWQGLQLRRGHDKDTCYHEIGHCVCNIDTILGSIGITIKRAYIN
jgi:hypothetical protein